MAGCVAAAAGGTAESIRLRSEQNSGSHTLCSPSFSYACPKLECYSVCAFAVLLKAYVKVYIIALYSI